MEVLPKFVDLAQTPQQINETMPSIAEQQAPSYPYGLCICLTQAELDKLRLDDDVDVGDLIHLHAMGKVTSVSQREMNGKPDNRVEIQLTSIAVEDEADEDEEAEGEMEVPHRVKNPYK